MKTNILPSYKEIKEKYPLDEKNLKFINTTQNTIRNIFYKKEKKLVIFTGPCSIHDEESALDYAKKLNSLQKNLKNVLLVMRVFFEKSRSKNSWKGFLYDPLLNNSYDISNGITRVRKLLLNLTKLKIPICCELLDPNASLYFNDLISWGFIGARTCFSTVHRNFASCLSIPIGFKNSVEGDINAAIHSAIVAKNSQHFIGLNEEGKISKISTNGNKLSHIILRGSNTSINYDKKTVDTTIKYIKEKNEDFPIIIDCSHGNAQNNHINQIKVFNYVINELIKNNYPILGLMLESHLNEGKQSLDLLHLRFGMSITDACINFEKTKDLIIFAENFLNQAQLAVRH